MRLIRSMHLAPCALVAACAAGCSSPSTTVSRSPSAAAQSGGLTRPSTIYVADFYLDPAAIEEPQGPADKLGKPGAVLKGIRGEVKSLRGQDPASKARELIGALSESIAKGLAEAGYRAERLRSQTGLRTGPFPSDIVLPKEGWLVTGWFEKVAENKPAVEATVGFGKGSGQVSIEVLVSDLAVDPRSPFLFIGSDAGRHKAPGGIVTLNPYVMGAKFVLARGETESDVRKEGAAIAKALIRHLEGEAGTRAPPPAP